MRALAVLIAASAALAACAGGGARTTGITQTDQERLQAQCDARGGVLVPSGRLTGRPPLDNFCRITDPTRTIPPSS